MNTSVRLSDLRAENQLQNLPDKKQKFMTFASSTYFPEI